MSCQFGRSQERIVPDCTRRAACDCCVSWNVQWHPHLIVIRIWRVKTPAHFQESGASKTFSEGKSGATFSLSLLSFIIMTIYPTLFACKVFGQFFCLNLCFIYFSRLFEELLVIFMRFCNFYYIVVMQMFEMK